MMSKMSYGICYFSKVYPNLDIVVYIDISSVQINEEIGYLDCIGY